MRASTEPGFHRGTVQEPSSSLHIHNVQIAYSSSVLFIETSEFTKQLPEHLDDYSYAALQTFLSATA